MHTYLATLLVIIVCIGSYLRARPSGHNFHRKARYDTGRVFVVENVNVMIRSMDRQYPADRAIWRASEQRL